METKLRILYLLKILEQHSDEEHPLTTNQILEMLNEKYGMSAHRTTIPAPPDFDIAEVSADGCSGERKYKLSKSVICRGMNL